MNHVLEHTRILWCGWDIPALIILAAVLAFCLYRIHRQKKFRKALQERVDAMRAERTEQDGELRAIA